MKTLITLLIFCLLSPFIYAEGSKQFLNNLLDSINPCALNVYNPNSGTGSIMNCPEFKRIYFRINDPATELIDIGFKQTNTTRYFRIFDPTGAIIVPGTLIANTGNAAGRIVGALQDIQGPSNALASGGYVPLVYTPTVAGDYWIEFNRDNDFVTPVLNTFSINLWDISIVSTATLPYTIINGRLHCKTWNIDTGSGISMKALVYAYTTDSIIHEIDFNGSQGINWTLSMNSYGCTNTGTIASDRMSRAGDASLIDTLGQYPLFFNLPDTTYYKVSQAPLQLSFGSTALSGCNWFSQNISQCINVYTNKSEVINLLIDLNGIPGFQAGTADTIITTNVVPGNNCIPWNGVDGLGNLVTPGTTINFSATIQLGITHIPLFDVEENPNGFIVHCILPASIANTPDLFYDDTGLGGGSSLNGCVSPCHSWSNTLGNNNTINTWFYGTFISRFTTVTGPANVPQFYFTITNPDCSTDLTNGIIQYNQQSPYVFQPSDSVGIYQAPASAPANYQVVAPPYKFTNLTPGTYTVIVKTIAGCTFDSTVTLVPAGLPTPSAAGANQYVCFPADTAVMAANAPSSGTGLWTQVSGGAATINNTSSPSTIITGLTSGTYTFQWTITSGTCPSSTSQVSLTITNPPATPTAGGGSPICSGNSIDLTASTISNTTYNWTGPNLYSSSSQNPVIPNSTVLMSGTYSVSVTDITTGCVSSKDTISIIVNQTPAIPVITSNSPLCIGDTIKFTIPATAGVVYNWTGPDGFSSSSQNPTILNSVVAMSGTYSLTLTNTSNNCTSTVDTSVVTVNLIPSMPVISGNTPVCVGSTLNLTASSTAGASYSWTGPAMYSSSFQNPVIPNSNPLQEGLYYVTANIANCFSPRDSILIAIIPLPATPPITSNSPICVGDTIKLSTPNTLGVSYSWTGPNSYVSTSQNPTLLNCTFAMAGTYYLIETNTTIGCVSHPDSIVIVINTLPAAPVASSITPICPGDSIHLLGNSIANVTYSWTGPNNFSSSSQNQAIQNATAAMTGIYNLTITSLNTGCKSSDTTYVEVFCIEPYSLTVPNVFTPNGDNINDLFMVDAKGVTSFTGEIYDRWGLKIFTWNEVNGGWDGRTTSGKEVSAGTYYYIINATGTDGNTHTEKGYLLLSR